MTNTMIVAAKPAHKPYNCGCSGHVECCELECLVHPRFFCGQLLADQDLTALVAWIQNKTGLARFRHGWGIVCGLGVHCGPRGSIIVSPGYALDCCGRDVVLCKEATFDISQCWKGPPSPCSDLTRKAESAEGEARQGEVTFGGFTVPRAQVQVFDVLIRYAEFQSDARTAIARGGCGGAAGCEYTRVHEDFQLYCSPANDCDDPNDREFSEWLEEYHADLVRKLTELAALSEITDVHGKLQRLIDYLQKFPPSTFCFLHEWLCDLQRQETLPTDWDRDLLFWIFQDWRNSRFRAPCKGCGPDTGIRLARVWLWMRRDSRGHQVFTTLFVNSHPPFRRMLAHDTWPAPAGAVNLAPYVWAQVDVAGVALERLGFTIDRREITLADLPRLVREEPLVVSTAEISSLTIYQHPDPCNQQRVVCFGGKHGLDIDELAADDPRLDLKLLPGINEEVAEHLKRRKIRNVVELAMAKHEDVRAALADITVNRPDENELIKLAKQHLDKLTKES